MEIDIINDEITKRSFSDRVQFTVSVMPKLRRSKQKHSNLIVQYSFWGVKPKCKKFLEKNQKRFLKQQISIKYLFKTFNLVFIN